MSRKLFIILGVVILAAVGYCFKPGEPDPLRERHATPEEAKTAVEFTRYAIDLAREKDPAQFSRRFVSLPPEEIGDVRELLRELPESAAPEKVTVPATGSDRRFVYYRIDDRRTCRMAVVERDRQWRLLSSLKFAAAR